MAAKFTLEGSGAGAVKAVQDFNKALDETEKKADKGAKASKRLEDAAKRIGESVDPTFKYNNQLARLVELATKAGLSTDHARLAAAKYGQELERAGKSTRAAFGADVLSNIAAMAAGALSLQAVVSGLTKAVTDYVEARKAAAAEAFAARPGMGSLAQLAATAPGGRAGKEARMIELAAEARALLASGAAPDENTAGALVFEMVSAGLGKEDRAVAGQLRSRAILQNIGGAAAAYDALKSTMGKAEVGTFQEFMSKAMQGASAAPGSFEGLPVAAARSGGSAATLGLSDEFVMAGTALIARARKSAEEGGTQMAAFLKQVEQSGVDTKGLTGVQIVEKIAAMPAAKQGYGGVLGDRSEAIEGFRTLKRNLPELRSLVGDIGVAEKENLIGQALALTDVDPSMGAANTLATAKGGLKTAMSQTTNTSQLLYESLMEERRTQLQLRTGGGIGAIAGRAIIGMEEFGMAMAGAEDAELREAITEPTSRKNLTPELLGKIERHLERINGAQRKKATTRQE